MHNDFKLSMGRAKLTAVIKRYHDCAEIYIWPMGEHLVGGSQFSSKSCPF